MNQNSEYKPQEFERLLNEDEVGEALGLSVSTLQKQRLRGDGPPFVKLGRTVRYRPSALTAYIEAGARRSTSEAPRAA